MAKKKGMSLKQWEASSGDEKHDAQQSTKGLRGGGIAMRGKGIALRGGGMALRGKGVALRGGGMATRGMGVALKKGGMSRKGK